MKVIIDTVTGLKAVSTTQTSITLSWNTHPDTSSYRIYRDNILIKSQIGSGYTDINLIPGQSYTYHVVAFLTINSARSLGVVVSTIVAQEEPISFFGGFDNRIKEGKGTGGNKNWFSVQGNINDLTLVPTNPGYYGNFLVKNNPNSTGTERLEVVNMQDDIGAPIYEDLSSGIVRYSFRTRFPINHFPIPTGDNNGKWAIFMQLHGSDTCGDSGHNPVWTLDAAGLDTQHKAEIKVGMRGGNTDLYKGEDFLLSNPSINQGNWINFIVTIKYGITDETSFIKVERKDTGETNYTTVLDLHKATLAYQPGFNNGKVGKHYMKMGLYRNKELFDATVEHDGFTREKIA
jgi:hypothetical protein